MTRSHVASSSVVLGVILCHLGCSYGQHGVDLGGCAESVTLMSPNNTNLLTHACRPEQKVGSQVAPNNSVVVTCSCIRSDAGTSDAATE